jgi:hypothetical protein
MPSTGSGKHTVEDEHDKGHTLYERPILTKAAWEPCGL